MKKYSSSTKKMTIGLDVGDQHSYYVVLDGEAEVIEEGRIRTRQEDFGKKFADLLAQLPDQLHHRDQALSKTLRQLIRHSSTKSRRRAARQPSPSRLHRRAHMIDQLGP